MIDLNYTADLHVDYARRMMKTVRMLVLVVVFVAVAEVGDTLKIAVFRLEILFYLN